MVGHAGDTAQPYRAPNATSESVGNMPTAPFGVGPRQSSKMEPRPESCAHQGLDLASSLDPFTGVIDVDHRRWSNGFDLRHLHTLSGIARPMLCATGTSYAIQPCGVRMDRSIVAREWYLNPRLHARLGVLYQTREAQSERSHRVLQRTIPG